MELDEIKPTIDNLFKNSDLNKLKTIAEDFYITWFASNTELIKSIGFTHCIEYLIALHEYYYLTWPDDALGFMEMHEIGSTIDVYRGCSESLEANKNYGLSWTTLPHIAKYYASQHSDGIVKHAKVSLKDILIFMSEESEILILPCNIKFCESIFN